MILNHSRIGFNTIIVLGADMRGLLIGVLSLFLVFFSIDSVVAESEEVDVSIGFDFSFGEIIDDEKIISGTVVSSEEEIEISWEIYNSTGFKYNWGLFDGESEQMTPLSGDYFSMDWEMLIKSNDYYSCSCEFKVSVSFDSNIILEETMPFFISNENYASDSNYTMLIENPLENDWINGNLLIEARISDITGENPSSAQIYVKRYVTFTETCNEEPIINIENDVSLTFNDDNFFSYELEMDTKPDGWYELVIIISQSNEPNIIDFHSCLSFKLNNLSPTISIPNPPSDIIEESFPMVIDASSSEDPIWSEENLYFIWTCTNSRDNNIIVHEGYDAQLFELDSSISAYYNLKLEVVDQGGLSSIIEYNFSISNLEPSSKLIINGVSVNDGDEVKLEDLGPILLDGSDSLDTENDLQGLRCIWSINGNVMFEGCENRELIWPENQTTEKELVLRLDVMDDDGDFSSQSVKLINPNVNDPLPYPLIVLFISFLFLISSIFYRFRKDSENTSIPKWSKGK